MPFDFRGTTVRVLTIDGEPWFVGGDVTYILGYRNGRDAIGKHVRDHQRGMSRIATPSGEQVVTVISEGGLYRLMLRANTVLADEFQDWVTDEVLPAVRATGSYAVPHALPQTFAEALRELASTVEAKELAEQRAAELEPAARSWTVLAEAGGDYSLRDAAQILDRDPAISTGQNRLSRFLRELNWIDSSGQPYQAQVDAGRLTRRATGGYADATTGGYVATWQVRITTKGLHKLHLMLDGSGPLLLSA